MITSVLRFFFQAPIPSHVILFAACVIFPAFPSFAYQDRALASDDNAAIEQVRETIDAILLILNEEQVFEDTIWPSKKKEIVALIKKRFDFRELSKRALGKYWKRRTDSEQDYFVTLFQDVLQNTYIDRLKAYSSEKIEFQRQILKGDKALVYCAFIGQNQEIPMQYKARKVNDMWLVYDIIIEGVSLIGNYRKQFAEIIQDDRYEGLIARMEEKVSQKDEKIQ